MKVCRTCGDDTDQDFCEECEEKGFTNPQVMAQLIETPDHELSRWDQAKKQEILNLTAWRLKTCSAPYCNTPVLPESRDECLVCKRKHKEERRRNLAKIGRQVTDFELLNEFYFNEIEGKFCPGCDWFKHLLRFERKPNMKWGWSKYCKKCQGKPDSDPCDWKRD